MEAHQLILNGDDNGLSNSSDPLEDRGSDEEQCHFEKHLDPAEDQLKECIHADE